MEEAKSGNDTKTPPPTQRLKGCIRFIAHIERKFHQYQAKKEKESTSDRMARRTANATVWMAIFTVILAGVGTLTLYEVVSGGSDTHNLAEATLAASRAWVVIQATGFGFTKDKNFPTGRVILEDSGSSPAFGVNGWRCVEVRGDEPPLQNGQLQKSPTAACLPITGGTLGRGVPLVMDAFVSAQVPGDFSKDTEDLGPHFYYWGIITYDIYPPDGRRHLSSFCLKNGGNQLSACGEGGYEVN